MIPLFLALVAAQPSALAEEASCIIDGFTPDERSRIVTMAQENAEPSPALQRRLEEVGMACVASRGWDEAQGGRYIGFAIATMIRDETADRLRRAGIDPALVAAWLGRQEERLRITPAIDPADAERLVLDLNAQGLPIELLEANGATIGAYVAGLAMVERVERGLGL